MSTMFRSISVSSPKVESFTDLPAFRDRSRTRRFILWKVAFKGTIRSAKLVSCSSRRILLVWLIFFCSSEWSGMLSSCATTEWAMTNSPTISISWSSLLTFTRTEDSVWLSSEPSLDVPFVFCPSPSTNSSSVVGESSYWMPPASSRAFLGATFSSSTRCRTLVNRSKFSGLGKWSPASAPSTTSSILVITSIASSEMSAQATSKLISPSRTMLSTVSRWCVNSDMGSSPIKAEVPLIVWNARKTLLTSSLSFGFSSKSRSAPSAISKSSVHSVINSPTIAVSISSGI